MWNKPWKLTEGFVFVGGLILTGLILQLSVGGINWEKVSYPLNVILLFVYLIFLIILFLFRKKVYLFRWMNCYTAVVPALVWTVVLTLAMGLVKQISEDQQPIDFWGLSQMLSFWPFVVTYSWMGTLLGLAVLNRLYPLKFKNIPFLLNHLGLFIALICATFGSGDIQRLTMNTQIGKPEWRAIDKKGHVQELPLAIELKEFTIDEYPPKLMLINNQSGKTLPEGKPNNILLEKGVFQGKLSEWNITIKKSIQAAAAVSTTDTTNYVKWPSIGATFAVYVKAWNPKMQIQKEGWVSCGSFLFPYQALHLDSACSLIMPDREPERFASTVKIYTEAGMEMNAIIEVNKPLKVENWKIYQLSYDEVKGRWSDISVFELVTDPWLPFVYIGICMMIAGALCLFITAQKKKEDDNELG